MLKGKAVPFELANASEILIAGANSNLRSAE